MSINEDITNKLLLGQCNYSWRGYEVVRSQGNTKGIGEMTININYDKTFALRSLFVLLILASLVGSYRMGFRHGMRAMTQYILSLQDEPKGTGDDETGNVGHFGK